MTTDNKCLRCGGTSLEPGVLQSTGGVYFRPENTRFFTFQTGDVLVKARICVDCGAIELTGDVGKARALTGQAGPEPEKSR